MPGRKSTSWSTAMFPDPPSATGSGSATSSTRTSTSTPRTTSPSSGPTSGQASRSATARGTASSTPATGPTPSSSGTTAARWPSGTSVRSWPATRTAGSRTPIWWRSPSRRQMWSLAGPSVRASQPAPSSPSQVERDKFIDFPSLNLLPSPDPGLRYQDLQPGRHDRLQEHRDREPLHEREYQEQDLCRQARKVDGPVSV